MVQKFSLPRDDRLAHAQNCVLSLFDIFQELNRRRKTFLHVVPYFAIRRIARQQPAVGRAQPELRHVVFVQKNFPDAVHFPEVHIRLHQPRFGFVVTKAWPRIEFLDHIQRSFYYFDRTIQRTRDFFQLIRLYLLEVLGYHLMCQSIGGIKRLQLKQQTFAQISRAYADRIEILYHGQCIIQIVLRVLLTLQ